MQKYYITLKNYLAIREALTEDLHLDRTHLVLSTSKFSYYSYFYAYLEIDASWARQARKCVKENVFITIKTGKIAKVKTTKTIKEKHIIEM